MNAATDPTFALPDLPTDVAGTIVVGFSGGLDSTVLLHRLATEPAIRARGLRAVHVHHGLQADADVWAAHCGRQAGALGVPLQSVRVHVPRDTGSGLEAAAREVRYGALRSALAAGDVLATAHHLDDQAETFLLRALRASGPDGLAAMRPLRRFGEGWQWRPLLALPRHTLLAYAHAHGLAWIEDPSNAMSDADRNFLRLQVMPLLQQRWPHAAQALARSAALSAEAADLLGLDDQAALDAARSEDPHELRVSALLPIPASRRARVLRRWIDGLGLPPLPATLLARIETELLPARDDARARLDWSGACLRRWRDLLRAEIARPPLPRDWQQEWDGRHPLPLPGGGALSLEGIGTLPWPVIVHARRGGERITLPGRRHSHCLKKVLQERQVPTWTRERLPIVSTLDGEVLAAGDRIFSARLHGWMQKKS